MSGIYSSVYADLSRTSVQSVEFLGQAILPTGTIFQNTELGGLSGISYDASQQLYYSISDDRSEKNSARFYTLKIDLSDGKLNNSDVQLQAVTTLKNAAGQPFAIRSLDPEGITLSNGKLYISSEGDANQLISPFVNQFALDGQQLAELPVDIKYLPTADKSSGIRNNLAFESLTVTPDQRYLYTATENALYQDGAAATLNDESPARIIRYDLQTGQVDKEILYFTDAVPSAPIPATGFSTNGLVDLFALDNNGNLLALERAFSDGVGNTIKLYQVGLQNAANIKDINALKDLEVDAVASKQLLLDFSTLNLPLDNIEGLTFGPKLPDGRQSLIVVSDNNFSSTQFTQVLAFALDLQTTPAAKPSLLSVASGDTNQTSTVLWAQSSIVGSLKFEYSTTPDFKYIFGYSSVNVSDPAQPVKAGFGGLTAGQTYYYRATDAAGGTATGQFKTSNAIGTQAGFRFGVTGDWRGELSPYPAIANADQRNLELFVELGDTIYGDYESPILPGVAQAKTLNEFRLKHQEVYDSRFGLNTWGDLRKSTSVLSMIDDHEVTNDFEGGDDLSKASAAKQALYGATTGLVNDSPLVENGLQAFQEYNPIRDEFYGNTGDARTAGERKLYRYNTYGQDAATFLLDARLFRDPEIAAVTNLSDPAQVGRFLTQSFDPTRTLLGKQQVSDLKQDLLAADQAGVTWKFVMVPEPIQNLGVLAAGDRFEGYAAERTELLKYIADNKIDNVVFVAADVHGTLVNNLTYQTAPGQRQIATNAFEITTGSVAFDAPFGQTVAELGAQLGLLTAQQKAFYDALPVANDADSLVNDKDDFIKQLTNDGLNGLGYDPLGLNANLPQADGLINAKLLQGDYLATHTFGWTEFDINPLSQKLTVTTYGVKSYTEAELLKNPAAIAGLTPSIVSQFEVLPN